MRIIGDIPHELYKITLYEWNSKFIVKIESGPYEQSFKIDQFDIDEKDISTLMDTEFMKCVTRRFHEMHQDLTAARERLA